MLTKKEIKKINTVVLFSLALTAFFVLGFASVKAATSVSSSTQTITLKDSDGDGLLDGNDPHPSIPEIYIVEDNNLNGIVDYFEVEGFSLEAPNEVPITEGDNQNISINNSVSTPAYEDENEEGEED